MLDKQAIKDALKNHKSNVIPMNYTDKQMELFKRFQLDKVKGGMFKDYFCHINDFEPLELLNSLGNNTEKDVKNMASIMKEIAHNVADAYCRKHVWILIRATRFTKEYDIPRWHMDGNYFRNEKSMKRQQSKFLTIFKGAGTLMIDPQPSKESMDKYNSVWLELRGKSGDEQHKIQTSSEFRRKLDKALENENKKQLKNTEGLVFMVGNKTVALVHSEPPKHEDRLFISIVPAYSYEIEEWARN
jgi:hypothetical protein